MVIRGNGWWRGIRVADYKGYKQGSGAVKGELPVDSRFYGCLSVSSRYCFSVPLSGLSFRSVGVNSLLKQVVVAKVRLKIGRTDFSVLPVWIMVKLPLLRAAGAFRVVPLSQAALPLSRRFLPALPVPVP